MEAKTHFARFMRRGMELARQLHSREIQRDEFDRAWKRLGDQIENETKKNQGNRSAGKQLEKVLKNEC